MNQKSDTDKKTIGLEEAWKIHQNIQELIRFADKKVGILLVISGVMTSFVFNSLSSLKTLGNPGYASLAIFLFAFGAFIFFSMKALFARLSCQDNKGVPQIIYFKNIANRVTANDYYQDLSALSEEEFLKDIAFQIYDIGVIADIKYLNYQISIWALGFQFLTFINIMWRVSL